ncbi:MAG TPA: hypothetical protein ENG48_12815 [Candidatus Atribacteria bacterium]|nr:hypothetical protein [Candidatus Atribacteria bacterium]
MITTYKLKSGLTYKQKTTIVKTIDDICSSDEFSYSIKIFNNKGHKVVEEEYMGVELHKQFIRFFWVEEDEKWFDFDIYWSTIKEITINELEGAVEIKYL